MLYVCRSFVGKIVDMRDLVDVLDVVLKCLLDLLLTLQEIDARHDLESGVCWPERVFLLKRTVRHGHYAFPQAFPRVVIE